MWNYYGSTTGTTSLPLTHIRATLYPYEPTSPNETYVTTVPVHFRLPRGRSRR